jgi:hypothetical protein
MKRLIVLLAAASIPLVAAACEPPEGSPPCTDITGGGGFYDGSTVLFSMDLAANPCTDVKYKFFVDSSDGGPLLGSATYRGTNNNQRIDFAVTVTDDDSTPNTVCVWGRTIAADGTKLDRAPDVGCVELTVGEDPGGRPFK